MLPGSHLYTQQNVGAFSTAISVLGPQRLLPWPGFTLMHETSVVTVLLCLAFLQVYIANLPMDALEPAVRALATEIGEVRQQLLNPAAWEALAVSSAVTWLSTLQHALHRGALLVCVCVQCAWAGHTSITSVSDISATTLLSLQVFQLRLPRLPDGRNKG